MNFWEDSGHHHQPDRYTPMTCPKTLPTLRTALAIAAGAIVLFPALSVAADATIEPAARYQHTAHMTRIIRFRVLPYPDVRTPRYLPAWAIVTCRDCTQ
jgi:hypothetical protein